MSYEINPCHACLEKFKRGECDVNNINNCCYDTLTAFSGNNSVNAVRSSEQAQNCVKCVSNVMRTMGPFGKTFCDLNLAPPPVFQQVPHYLPGYLHNGHNLDEATKLCINQCHSSSNHKYGCIENCLTDAAAVVEPYKDVKSGKKYNTTYGDYTKTNPVPFYIAFALVAILLAFVLVVFFKTLTSRKIGL